MILIEIKIFYVTVFVWDYSFADDINRHDDIDKHFMLG